MRSYTFPDYCGKCFVWQDISYKYAMTTSTPILTFYPTFITSSLIRQCNLWHLYFSNFTLVHYPNPQSGHFPTPFLTEILFAVVVFLIRDSLHISFDNPGYCRWVYQIVKLVLMQPFLNIFTFLLFQNILVGFVFSDTLIICCLYNMR